MPNRSHILNAVFVAVASTNETLPVESKLKLVESELIIGDGSKIESLGFVTLMVFVEQEVEIVVGSCPSLVEELSDPASGVLTLGALVDFIVSRV